MLPKVLIAGDWRWDIYEEALASGFRSCGWAVVPFKTQITDSRLLGVSKKLKLGPGLFQLNKTFFEECRQEKPALIFLYRTDLIVARTIARIRRQSPDTRIAIYHNDNPFVGITNWLKWRHYLVSLRFADHVFVYRPSNISQARVFGAKSVSILLPYYISYVHYPESLAEKNRSIPVLFVGHYEADGRLELLDSLVRRGIPVRVFGTGWEEVTTRFPWLAAQKVRRVWGQEYAHLLRSAKITLGLFSGRNRDVWTRRCFEATACQSMLLAERTEEMCKLFKEGQEAVYFGSADELVEKARHALVHDEERERIALHGSLRCRSDQHNEIGRAAQILDTLGFS